MLNSLTLKLSALFTEKYMKFDEDDDLCKGCKLFQYIHFILDYLNQIFVWQTNITYFSCNFCHEGKIFKFFGVCQVLKPFGQTFCSLI